MTTKTYGKVKYADGRWGILANPDVTIRIRRIFPRCEFDRQGVVILQHSDEVCRDLEWVLERWPMEIDDATRGQLGQASQAYQQRVEMVHQVLSGGASLQPFQLEPELPPRPYQREAHTLAVASGGLLLADELGLGKTLTSLLTLADPALRPALVVTLTGLERQWQRELAKVFPTLRSGVAKKRTPHPFGPPALFGESGDPDIIVMNYSKLDGWAKHLAGTVRTVIFDEVQELRHRGTQKHTAAGLVADKADVRWGLSATPVYNFGGEMYSILSVLRPGMLGTEYEFAKEWCGVAGLDTKTRVTNPKALRAHLVNEGAMLRRTRPEVGIQLPPARLVEQYVDADEAALDKAAGDAAEIARLILNKQASHQEKWQASGDLDWRMRQATGIAKAPFVAGFVRLLLESEQKVLLLGWHRAVYDLWMEQLREFNPVLYTGTESTRQKGQAFDRFVNGDSRVLIMSLRSGAGLDGLQDVAQVVVFGELDWSPGVHKQVVGRLHRPGQEQPVIAYFTVSEHGSDPVIAEVLNVKAMEADMLVAPEQVKDGGAMPPDVGRDHMRRLAESVLARRSR